MDMINNEKEMSILSNIINDDKLSRSINSASQKIHLRCMSNQLNKNLNDRRGNSIIIIINN